MKVKFVLTGILVGLLFALPLCVEAQERESTTIFVRPVTGGTQEEKSYFLNNIKIEILGAGYTVVEVERNAKYIFALRCLQGTDAGGPWKAIEITVTNRETGRELLTCSQGYTNLTDMDYWNLILVYQALANIPLGLEYSAISARLAAETAARLAAEETARLATGTAAKPPAGTVAGPPAGTAARPPAGTAAIPPAGTAAIPPAGTAARPPAGTAAIPPAGTAAIPPAMTAANETGAAPKYPQHWLYLGIQGAYSARFYTGPVKGASGSNWDVGHTYEAGIRISGQVLPWLAIQSETTLTQDVAKNKNTGTTYDSVSLKIPLLLKATFRFGDFVAAPLGGLYYNIPLGNMKVTTNGGTEVREYNWNYYNFRQGLGWIAGFEVGYRLGPGILFLGARYSADLDGVIAGGDAAYRRAGITASLGYDFGLLQKGK